MNLYVDAMDATLVEFDDAGRVRFEGEDWTTPSLQEARAILYAARTQLDELQELADALERHQPGDGRPAAAPMNAARASKPPASQR